MMKRTCLHLLASALLLAFSGCGDSAEEPGLLTIEAVAPQPVQQGQTLRLMGRFGPEPEEARATVSGVCTAVTGWSDSQVTILVPRGAGTGGRLVVLQADGLASNAAPVDIVGPDHPQDTAYCGEGLIGGLP